MANHRQYSQRRILRFHAMNTENAAISMKQIALQKFGVRYQGVGGSVAWPLSGVSWRVSLTSGRPSPSVALA